MLYSPSRKLWSTSYNNRQRSPLGQTLTLSHANQFSSFFNIRPLSQTHVPFIK